MYKQTRLTLSFGTSSKLRINRSSSHAPAEVPDPATQEKMISKMSLDIQENVITYKIIISYK